MEKQNLIKPIVSFSFGIIGGIVALFIAILLEIILSVLGKPPLSLAKDPIFLLALFVPALLEEVTKTTIANKLFDRWGSVWVILGTGVGFGLAETYLAQSSIPLKFSSALLPFVHLIFLLGGYLIAKLMSKGNKLFYFEWLIAGTLLHWGYNVAQVVFLLKP